MRFFYIFILIPFLRCWVVVALLGNTKINIAHKVGGFEKPYKSLQRCHIGKEHGFSFSSRDLSELRLPPMMTSLQKPA